MATYTITSTAEQDTALSLMATTQNIQVQQLVTNLVSDMLNTLVATQKQNLLNNIQEDSLETLESLSTEAPASTPAT
jgi:hypothetical protein